jgi:hypothetical protein
MKHLVFPLLACALLSSCVSKYYDARFGPQATEAVAVSNAPGGQARSIVSFVGVRRKDRETGAPPQVEFKLRVENLGSIPCTLEQHSLQLLSGALEPFGAAQLTGADAPVIAPGASANYALLFPPAEGRTIDSIDLRSLNLRWGISFDGETITNGMTFERISPGYYDSSTSFSLGFGFWGH